MSFRHYTKLKEIAKKYGCDSSGCDSNGDLIDRLYETPITPVDPDQPVEPTGPIIADIGNITARFVRPVEGHRYNGIYVFSTDTWLLQFDNVLGYRDEKGRTYYPAGLPLASKTLQYQVLVNDVENAGEGNLMICVSATSQVGFDSQTMEQIRNELETNGSVVLEGVYMAGKFTITSIAE